jgi:hypothetical protein
MKPIRKNHLILILAMLPLILACGVPSPITEQVRIFLHLPVVLDDENQAPPPTVTSEENQVASEIATPMVEEQSQTAHENEPIWGFESDESATNWSIEQCNALNDFSVSVIDFEETVFNSGAKKCDFNYSIRNSGDRPAHIFFYLYYSKNGEVPDNTAYGWVRGGDPEPGEVRLINNHFSSNPTGDLKLFMDTAYSIAFTYDIPECHWITRAGTHKEILEIQNVDLLRSNFPCSDFAFDAASLAPGEIETGLIEE